MAAGRGMIGQSGCGCNVYGVSQVNVSGDGYTVGIVGLQAILRQLHDAGCPPDEPSVPDELLGLVKARNCVPHSLEPKYRAALSREYAAFCARAA